MPKEENPTSDFGRKMWVSARGKEGWRKMRGKEGRREEMRQDRDVALSGHILMQQRGLPVFHLWIVCFCLIIIEILKHKLKLKYESIWSITETMRIQKKSIDNNM